MKRYKELTNNEVQTLEKLGAAKPGKRHLKAQAVELHNLLRTYTYRIIGIQNAFRRIAADFSALDGSNWRNNRHLDPELRDLAERLYKMDPGDWQAVLKIEAQLEHIARVNSNKRGAK